jgi:hypothetical protein
MNVNLSLLQSASAAVSTGKATGGLPASVPTIATVPAPPVPGLPPVSGMHRLNL